jgi:hypothetical protein
MVWGLYKTQPSFVLGFHGCDEEVGRAVIAGEGHLQPSVNAYDWLGNGVYFWEGSPQRAMEWADSVHRRRPAVVRRPFVVGAIIDLGLCCNLTDKTAATELKDAFEMFEIAQQAQGLALPDNKGGTLDRLLRYRDRAVIELPAPHWCHDRWPGAAVLRHRALALPGGRAALSGRRVQVAQPHSDCSAQHGLHQGLLLADPVAGVIPSHFGWLRPFNARTSNRTASTVWPRAFCSSS